MEEIPATHPEELTQSSPPKSEPHDDVANADITNDSEARPIASTGSSGEESRSKLVDTSEDTTGPKLTLAEPEPAPSVPDKTSAPKQRREWSLIKGEFQTLPDTWVETQVSSENIVTYFHKFKPMGSHDLYIVSSDGSRFVAKNIQGDGMLQLIHDIGDTDIKAAIVRLEVTSSEDSAVFPLDKPNYDKLLNFFDPSHSAARYWNNALRRSDAHFETYGEGLTLRLPPLHQTWSDISVVFRDDSLGLTTGLSEETFRQVHKSCRDYFGDQACSGIYFMHSLFRHLADEVAKEIVHSRSILKLIEESLAVKIPTSATDTGPLRGLWIEQEVPLGPLNSHLVGLIVSAAEARSRLKYISAQIKEGLLFKLCEERLTEVAFLEQRISTNISVVSNMLAQKEIDWNHKMNISQQVIAILTMLFLPSTFFAVLFTMPLFNWNPQPGERVLNSRFWIYCAFAASTTAVLFLLYFIWQIVKRKREGEREGEREKKREGERMRDEERGDMHKIKQG